MIGRMDKKITIYTTTDVSDDGWNNSKEEVFHKCWAELMDISSRDYQFSLTNGTVNQQKLRIRYKKGITTEMNIEINGERYSIVTKLNEDSRKPYMMLVIERKDL